MSPRRSSRRRRRRRRPCSAARRRWTPRLTRVRGGARLLTVTGYGGTGKTRFSIELFHRLVPEYPGGAAFVSLAAVTAASAVLPTVCIALEIPEAHGRSALDALCTVIGQRRMLIVLDNLEQVIDVAEEIAALVARCPALQVIATSRAPLKIGTETEFSLPPLAAAGAGHDVARRAPELPVGRAVPPACGEGEAGLRADDDELGGDRRNLPAARRPAARARARRGARARAGPGRIAPAARSRAGSADVRRSRPPAPAAHVASDDQLELLAARRGGTAAAAPAIELPRRLDTRSDGAGLLPR